MALLSRLAAALALACLISSGSASARQMVPAAPAAVPDSPQRAAGRTLSVDDVLAMETFGSAALSPDGAWVVYERRRAYDTAPRFDRSHRSGWAVSELRIARTDGGPPEPLLPAEPDTGLLLVSWSPDSRRLLVHRLRGDRLEIGLVEVADRSVVWTGLTPDLVNGVTSAWLDGDRLALTIRPAGDLPWLLRFDGTGQTEMARRWARTAEGRAPSRSRIETHGGRVTTDAPAPPVQLIVLDVSTGARQVLKEGEIRDFAVSPAGDRIAVLTSAERAARVPLGEIDQSAVQTRSRLSLVAVDSGEDVPAGDALDVAPHLLRWSPTGDAVLVWARRDGEAWGEARLISVGVGGEQRAFETGDLQPFEEGRNVDEVRLVQADWLGRDALLRARKPGTDRFDWWRLGANAPRAVTAGLASAPGRLSAIAGDEALAFAEGRLWAFGGADGLRALTAEAGGLSDGRTWTLMTPFRVQANEPPRQTWIAARTAGGARIIGGGGASDVVSTQACAGVLQGRSVVRNAVLTVCLDQGVETMALAAPGVDRRLDRVNPGLADLAVPQARAIVHKDPFGRDVTSYLFLPPGWNAGEAKGLIVLVYPGVVETGRHVEATSLQTLGPRAQLLASEGYAVLSAAVPDEGRSTRASMIDDFVRGTDLAVDAALAREPGLPSDRMALLGHSFGGYTALAIATRPTRFRSVVAWAAATDPAARWGELGPHARIWPEYAASLDKEIGAVEDGQASMGGPPWSDLQAYAAASPYLMADRITAPLLLITADRDYVPMTNSERMLAAMHRQGRWARLVTYWGETHSNASPANVRDVYREIFDWLDRTLGDQALRPPAGAAPMPEPSPRSPPSS